MPREPEAAQGRSEITLPTVASRSLRPASDRRELHALRGPCAQARGEDAARVPLRGLRTSRDARPQLTVASTLCRCAVIAAATRPPRTTTSP